MALSMNRYIGNSILPLLIQHSKFYSEAENYATILDATLHTVYRLSKNRMLTKGQREAVSDFLVALTSQLQPSMLLKLLRKLTVDVSNLSEYTTVALRLLTLHYDRCAKYYGSSGGQGRFSYFFLKHFKLLLCRSLWCGQWWRKTAHNDVVLQHFWFSQ